MSVTWGNAFHGKITGADIALPNAQTHTLTAVPNTGETRLIEFAGLDSINLTQSKIDELLLEGKAFKTYAILSDGKLYDKAFSKDLWLYKATDGKVWKITPSIVVTAGDAQVTLNYSRFGEFILNDLPSVPVLTGQVVANVFTSNSAEAGGHNSQICDISPDGTKAIFQISYTATTTQIAKINYIEVTISGVIDENGNGLIATGTEVVNQAEGLNTTDVARQNTINNFDYYRERIVLLDESPPPTTSTPNNVIDYSFHGTSKLLKVPGGDPAPPDTTVFSGGHATPTSIIDEGARYTYDHVYWMLYDKANVSHKYQISIVYDDLISRTQTESVSGIVDVNETIRQTYDGSGAQLLKTYMTQTMTGRSQFDSSNTYNRVTSFVYQLKRDNSIVSSLTSNNIYDASNSGGGFIEGDVALFSTGFGFGYAFLNSQSLPSTLTEVGSSDDIHGNSFIFPAETPTYRYAAHFEQMFDGNANTQSQPNFYIVPTSTNMPQDIEVFKPTNNLMCLRTGLDLNQSVTDVRRMHQMATPEGRDNVIFNDPTTRIDYNYAFNPYDFELVREDTGPNVNFI